MTPYITTEVSLSYQTKFERTSVCLNHKSLNHKTGAARSSPVGWPPFLRRPAAWPLVLIALGFSGAWIGNLTVLEPYRPIFIGAALVALFFAWRRIYRPAQACKPGEVCAIPQVRATYKLIFWIVAALVLVSLGFPYVMPFFY